ncbi:hypothetical protein [Deinococcus sp.]|uniref:hypothetical protein n=1 Tax=Deinococcus sp. TaxID=47478 RepID=UPI002869DEA6|nr:hypothetical protein [Deinococcus sp.]
MDDLALHLAHVARDLQLSGHTVQDAPEAAVRDLAVAVLEALVARGLIDGPEDIGCWARPRSQLS